MKTHHECLPFTPEIDQRIMDLVEQHGKYWTRIEKELGEGYSRTRIRFRYLNTLQPKAEKVDDLPWTKEDTQRLVQLIERYGNKWSWFSNAFFDKRAPNFLRHRYWAYLNEQKSKNKNKIKAKKPAKVKVPKIDAPKTEAPKEDDVEFVERLFLDPPYFDFDLDTL